MPNVMKKDESPSFIPEEITSSEDYREYRSSGLAYLTRILDLAQHPVQVAPETIIEDVAKMIGGKTMGGAVVVSDDRPVGLVMKHRLDQKLGSRYGVSLYYHRPISKVMDNNPLIVDANSSLEDVARAAVNREQSKIYDDIIITHKGKLEGTVSVQKVLENLAALAEKERDAAETDNKKIRDSLRYAKMIQESILPKRQLIKRYFPDSFCIWMPKDIVGGDIYFAEKTDEGLILILADCTGHGVPGALMTMIAYSGLRKIVSDDRCHDPAAILKKLNNYVKTILKKEADRAIFDDGLDAGVCYIDSNKDLLTYAGAKFPLVYIHDKEIHVVKGDRQSIGYMDSDLNFEYTNKAISLSSDMVFYLYTDGYVDQLGGQDRLPFGNKHFRKFLREIHTLPFEEQKNLILDAFHCFKGDNDIQDDITIIGFSLALKHSYGE